MRDGIYTVASQAESAPHTLIIVKDNQAVRYTVDYDADYSIYSLWGHPDELIDVSVWADDNFHDMAVLISNIEWGDEAVIEYYDFVPAEFPQSHETEGNSEILDWWFGTFC